MPAESSGKPVQTSGTLPAEVTSFAARKEARARELAAKFKAELPPAVWAYFAAATRGSWPEVARLGEEVRNLPAPPENRRPGPAVVSQVWAGVMETYMAFAQFALGEPKYAFAFGRGIIQSIPPGSIYFGGTDAGRGLVTALCRKGVSAAGPGRLCRRPEICRQRACLPEFLQTPQIDCRPLFLARRERPRPCRAAPDGGGGGLRFPAGVRAGPAQPRGGIRFGSASLGRTPACRRVACGRNGVQDGAREQPSATLDAIAGLTNIRRK